MNGLPHLLVEGCLISMHAIRASKCYIYIRGEYIEPWKSVQKAINEAYAKGFCGKNVQGSGLDFDIYNPPWSRSLRVWRRVRADE